jgi:hypothetical protein
VLGNFLVNGRSEVIGIKFTGGVQLLADNFE